MGKHSPLSEALNEFRGLRQAHQGEDEELFKRFLAFKKNAQELSAGENTLVFNPRAEDKFIVHLFMLDKEMGSVAVEFHTGRPDQIVITVSASDGALSTINMERNQDDLLVAYAVDSEDPFDFGREFVDSYYMEVVLNQLVRYVNRVLNSRLY